MRITQDLRSSLLKEIIPSDLRLGAPVCVLAAAILMLLLATRSTALAGSATWNLNPTSGDWNTATNWTPTGTPAGCTNYTFTTGTDPLVPGSTDTGNHTDDGDTFVALPFSFQLYDQTYNGVNVNSNGRLDFVCINEPMGYLSACLPAPANQCPYDYTIFPLWTDYRTDIVGEGCSTFASGCGIFTSVSGTAPNRIFNIEWRVVYFLYNSRTANFEARLYENDSNKRFEFVFGTVIPGSDQLYVSGVQGPGGAFTQDFCLPSTDAPPTNVSRTYEIPPCASPTPTPGPIQLRARQKRVGGINTVQLNWRGGAHSPNIDIYRNKVLVATQPNDPGVYIDSTGDTGRAQYTYRVCEAGTRTCSNDVLVRFPR